MRNVCQGKRSINVTGETINDRSVCVVGRELNKEVEPGAAGNSIYGEFGLRPERVIIERKTVSMNCSPFFKYLRTEYLYLQITHKR